MEIKKDADYCFVVPVETDKVHELKGFWRDAGTKKANMTDVYLREMGLTRLMAFLETMPREHYLTQYVRGTDELRAMFMKGRNINLPIADFFMRGFEGFAGYDFTAPENIPDLELMLDWSGREVRDEASKKRAVYAVKLLPGVTDEIKRVYSGLKEGNYVQKVTSILGDTVLRGLVFLQHRPEGDYIIKYVETTEDVETLREKLLRSKDPELKHMLKSSKRYTGIDIKKPGNLPRVELLFDWSAEGGARIGEAAIAHHR